MTTRRGFLASILAAGVAPAAVGSSILMPVRKLVDPAPWMGVDLASGPDRMVVTTLYGVSVAVPPPEMQRIRNEAWAMLAAALPLRFPTPNDSRQGLGPTVKFVRRRP